ncbi:MAG: glycoside hydrolase family 127 protein [Lentisphaerae bacterium]|jgi:uncharacterized protein|nr:glycoside hydrolase family 127 protein [Lentisphaerota bacterium]MBT5607854.1 glycoside hydrolase family 127 protein [Lentisphaerota bacterium]MBT7054836.1 glycoside hydrolase family 127 protein [Lentisphaerota bacterium]MBT7845576.1 glycoside hydrolase family 127 protein [Lentisphaerota bacterium]
MTTPEIFSPHRKLTPVPMAAARWTDGFWAERFTLCRETVIPRMKEALEHPDNSACLSNFRIGAGLEEGAHRGTNWSDGDCYKWLETVAHVYALTEDPELDREMDHWIDLIGKTQEEDGYISTQTQLNADKERWGKRQYHELYNMGHLLTAACVHKKATGKDTFVAIAVKLADYLYGLFGPRPVGLAHFGWNPSNIMGLVDLYRTTADRRYLELAGIFVDMRGSQPTGWAGGGDAGAWGDGGPTGDQNQDRVPLRKETEAVGHAVTATYLWCGAADVIAETGDDELLAALDRIWRDMVETKMYITGAVGPYHHGISPRRDPVHEAFGRVYELPNATAYNETCANIGNGMWNKRMFELTGDAKYADLMELVLFNSALSTMDIDGERFCYTNPLAQSEWTPVLSQDAPNRWSEFHCYCCPPQVARTLAKTHEWAYSVSEKAVWVNLFGSSALETDVPGIGPVKLTQQTDYPWDGTVTITVEDAPSAEFALQIRIPGWAGSATLIVNGEAADAASRPGTYAAVKRNWSAGDAVTLVLPMRPRLMMAHPEVEESHNQVAVMYGPMVYCLEAPDLPEGVPVHEAHIPRDIELTATFMPELLGGITVLEGTACRRRNPDWTGKLYAELPKEDCECVPIRLIPNYAWLNRGQHDMRIWLPLA